MLGLFSFKNPRFYIVFLTLVYSLLITCIFVVGYLILTIRSGPISVSKDTLAVPALVGRNINEAKARAELFDFKIEVDKWIANKTYPAGYVVTQKPLPGTKIKRGEKIIIKVSGGCDYPAGEYGSKQSVIEMEDPKPLPTPPLQQHKSLSGKIVVIDPGHQSHADLLKEPIGPGSEEMKERVQGGTTGVESKTPEYKITLDIAKKVNEKLEQYGIKVVMTRDKNDVNVSNKERAQIANDLNADLFIRIHADGNSNPKMDGISTLYPAINEWTEPIAKESFAAAEIVHKNLVSATEHKDNGIVPRNDLSGFNWSKVPVVLVEVGFMTNPEEDILLNDEMYQEVLASGISSGVVEYLSAQTR